MALPEVSKKRKLESNGDDWTGEQDYELRPRKVAGRESTKLPLKQDYQLIQQEVALNGTDDENDSFLGTSDDDNEPEEEIEEANGHDDTPKLSHKEEVFKAKEELADLAAQINESPEDNISSFKALADIYRGTNNLTVKQLVLATQCAVYKDLAPGYRIRPLTDEEANEKVSKDVKKLRSYEQSLVTSYKGYVRELENCAKRQDAPSLLSIALNCASTLLLALPHFNFRTELIKIVISPFRRRYVTKDFERSLQTLEKLFREDDDGRPSLEALTAVTKLIKGKDYNVNESLINLFLSLRLLSEFNSKGSYDSIDRPEYQSAVRIKRREEKKRFKSKRERKLIKERKGIEKEFREADALVSHEERDRMQADMLKQVFATYFRILKARVPHLMGAVLEGLAKHAHLINQDFFGDILEALKDIIRSSSTTTEDGEDEEQPTTARDGTREALLCIVTAFALLQGQDGKTAGKNLHLDLSFFISYLYQTLIPTMLDADVERSSKSLHLDDPTDPSDRVLQPNVNIKTKTVMLIRSLSSVMLPKSTSINAVPPLRLAAFTKQLMTASLQLPEKSCQAVLGLLAQTTQLHGRKIAGLWSTEERRGDGVFDALRGDVEGSNPFASTVWEGELLRRHYSPKVKEAIGIVEKNVKGVLYK
jgi:nucleolar complex protein 3